jgi:hypothetical protein
MTVLSTTAKAGPYAGAGTTGPFAVPFRFLENSHLRVIRTSTAGVDTDLVLTTDYTVTGAGASSGSVTLVAALAVGEKLTVIRSVPATQEADYVPGDAFPAESHEEALDKLTMLTQQNAEELSRTVRVRASSTADAGLIDPEKVEVVADNMAAVQNTSDNIAFVIDAPVQAAAAAASALDASSSASAAAGSASAALASANAAADTYDQFDDRYLGSKATAPTVDNDGNPLIVGAVYWDTVSNQMFTWSGTQWTPTFLTGNAVRALVTATAGQTVVTVPTYVIGANTLSVFVNGVKVLVGADYAETNQNTITFSSGLALNDEVEAIAFQAYPIGTTGAELVSFQPSGTGAVATNVQSKLREFVSVLDFGAVGDGVADDTAAINLALAYLAAIGGGTLYFPQGTYKTTSEILINSRRINLRGTGKRSVYPGLFVPSANTPSTIMPVHSGRNAIRFFNTVNNDINAFTAEGINLATLETGSVPTAAFGWDVTGTGAFQRDFTFDGCGIHGFTSAFDVYGVGASTEMGLLKVRSCNINRNTWIARTLNGTQWNGFVFRDNEAGQNGFLAGQGGISVSAHACAIEDNCMEGMRDPIKIAGSYRGVRVAGNYFESNVGRACVELASIRGSYFVGPNTYLDINNANLAHKVLLQNCGLGDCVDPYWSEVVHKGRLPLLGADSAVGDNVLNNSVNTVDYGFVRVDRVEGNLYLREPQYATIAKQRVTISAREIDPQSGLPMPVQEYTTAGAGAVGLTYTISGGSGSWVVVSWLMKQQAGSATANPYVSLSVNGTGAAGSKDYPINNWTTFWRTGEWALITCVIKLGTSMTSLGVTMFPHGVNPAAGLVSRFLRPVVYTVSDVNDAVPYIDQWIARSVVGQPTAGTWKQGDLLFNAAPTAQYLAEFSCIADGTPGTWAYA